MLQDFFHMDGYAAYVWSSYALTAVVLIANIVSARRRFREELAAVRRRVAAGGQS